MSFKLDLKWEGDRTSLLIDKCEVACQVLKDHVLVRSVVCSLHGVHLKCPYTNVHSLRNKKEELEALALSRIYEITGIT